MTPNKIVMTIDGTNKNDIRTTIAVDPDGVTSIGEIGALILDSMVTHFEQHLNRTPLEIMGGLKLMIEAAIENEEKREKENE